MLSSIIDGMTTTCSIETFSLSLFDFGATVPGARTCWISALTEPGGQPEFHVHGQRRPTSWEIALELGVKIASGITLHGDVSTWEVTRGGHDITETLIAPFLRNIGCRNCDLSEQVCSS